MNEQKSVVEEYLHHMWRVRRGDEIIQDKFNSKKEAEDCAKFLVAIDNVSDAIVQRRDKLEEEK